MKMLVYKGLAVMMLAAALPVSAVGLPAQAAAPAGSAADREYGPSGQYRQDYQHRYDDHGFLRHRPQMRECVSPRALRGRWGRQRRAEPGCTPYQRLDRYGRPWQGGDRQNSGGPWNGPGNR